jgi:hypothetical protein
MNTESHFDSYQNDEEAAGKKDEVKAAQGSDYSQAIDPLGAVIDETPSDSSQRRRSPGPRTVQGKRISSQNALTHGFFSRDLIRGHLHTKDRRAYLRLFNGFLEELKPDGQSEFIQVELITNHLYQYRRLFLMANEFGPLEEDSGPDDALTVEKFQRCESHILKNFYRAKAELERLQRIRLGEKVPARLMVDINS